MKIKYDFRNKLLLLRSKDKAYLRLHKDYTIQEQHKKLDNQKCESLLMKRRVDRFAYELNISFKWKIHSVISVTQLKSALFVQNSYNKSRSKHSESIYVKEDNKFEKSYEIEAIIDKRVRKFERTSVTQYKIKWLRYDLEFDEWKFVAKLDDCMNLVKNYEKQLTSDIQRERWSFSKDKHLLRAPHGALTNTLASFSLHLSIRRRCHLPDACLRIDAGMAPTW